MSPDLLTASNQFSPSELERIKLTLDRSEQHPNDVIRSNALAFIEAKNKNVRYVDAKGRTFDKGPVYLAGPMSGYKDHNFPLFDDVTEVLRQQGWYVLNPAENFNGNATETYETHYLADIKLIELCSDIAFLDGWEKSGGAVGEYILGDRLNKGLWKVTINDVYGVPYEFSWLLNPLKIDSVTFTPFKRNQRDETVLQEADRLVATDRQSQYGHPFDDFSRTAALWTATGFGFYCGTTEKGPQYRAVEP